MTANPAANKLQARAGLPVIGAAVRRCPVCGGPLSYDLSGYPFCRCILRRNWEDENRKRINRKARAA